MSFNKVLTLLALAGVFISFVMISVVYRGVELKPQRILKWSSVQSPEQAGDRLALFFYPLLKKSKIFNIQWEGAFEFDGKEALEGFKNKKELEASQKAGFYKLFSEAFLRRVKKEGLETEIVFLDFITSSQEALSLKKNSSGFFLVITALGDQVFCRKEKDDSTRCLKQTKLKQFNRKTKDPSLLWISVDRLGKDRAILFFRKNVFQ